MDKNEATKISLPIIKNLARRTKRPHSWEIEDVIQIGLLAILENLHKYDPERGTFHAWALIRARKAIMWETTKNQGAYCQSAENVRYAKKHHGKEAHLHNAVEYKEFSSGSVTTRPEAAAELALAWKRLSPKLRSIFALLAADEDGETIGAFMGISRGGVNWHVRNHQKALAAAQQLSANQP